MNTRVRLEILALVCLSFLYKCACVRACVHGKGHATGFCKMVVIGRHSTHDSPLNFDLTLNTRVSQKVLCG